MTCIDGADAPQAGDFTCTIDASTLVGGTADATCSLQVDVAS